MDGWNYERAWMPSGMLTLHSSTWLSLIFSFCHNTSWPELAKTEDPDQPEMSKKELRSRPSRVMSFLRPRLRQQPIPLPSQDQENQKLPSASSSLTRQHTHLTHQPLPINPGSSNFPLLQMKKQGHKPHSWYSGLTPKSHPPRHHESLPSRSLTTVMGMKARGCG